MVHSLIQVDIDQAAIQLWGLYTRRRQCKANRLVQWKQFPAESRHQIGELEIVSALLYIFHLDGRLFVRTRGFVFQR